MTETTLTSNSKTARIAASLFFFLCLPMYFWESSNVSKIFVANDPVATANNLLSNEFVFRVATVSHMAGTIIFVIMVLMFCRLFRPVDKYLTRIIAAFILVQIPIVLILEVFNIAALMTLKSEPRATFDVTQQQEVAYFLLRLHRYGLGTGKLFLGLCFIPFGMVVFKSGFAPRVIGILLLINGVGYIGDFCIYVLLQRPDYIMVRSITMYSYFGFILVLLWFLIKGVRDPKPIVN